MAVRQWKLESPWQVLALSVVIFAGTLALTYSTLFTADREDLCGGYDVFRALGPQNFYMDYCIHHGYLPWWNPLTLCGMPFAANPVTSFFYPFNLLRSLLSFDPTQFKTQIGWIVLTALHVLIMGVGVVFLARSHRLSFPAALVAAFALLFSAIWTRRICEHHFVCMAAWAPWLLLISRQALLSAGPRAKMRWGYLGALILGTALLSGSMNIAPYLGVLIGIYTVLHRLLLTKWKERPQWRRMLWGDALFLIVMFGAGAAVAAALLVPGEELALHSSRASTSALQLRSPAYKVPARELYEELIRFPGLKFKPEAIRAAGIGVWVLALCAVISVSWRTSALYFLLFLALFDCSLGRPWPLATLIETLSPIQLYGSNRAFEFALLPLAMLAGLGVDAATAEKRGLWKQLVRLAVVLGGAGLLYSLYPLLGPGTFLEVGREAIAVPAVLLAVVLLAGWLPHPAFWRICFAALIFGETYLWNQYLVPRCILREGYANYAGEYTGEVEFWADNTRVTDHFFNRSLYALAPSMNGYEPVHIAAVRAVLADARRGSGYQRRVYDYETVQENNRGNLFLKRQFWLARQYVYGPLRSRQSLFPPATTVYLKDRPSPAVPEAAESDVPKRAISSQIQVVRELSVEELNILNKVLARESERRFVSLPAVTLPKKHCVLHAEFRAEGPLVFRPVYRDSARGRWEHGKRCQLDTPGLKNRLVELPVPDMDILETQVNFSLPPKARLEFTRVQIVADGADEGEAIQILERTANQVALRVGPLPGPRILVFLDAMYSDWHAYVDGTEVKILLANDAFKAIELGSGTHTVRFEYRPRSVALGAAVSLAAILLCLAGLVLLRPSPRPVSTP